jgi:hypothetical protein
MEPRRVEWYDLPRREVYAERLPDEHIADGILRKNISYGINLYENVLSKEDLDYVINGLEENISGEYNWSMAQLNGREEVEHARNCIDFKVDPKYYVSDSEKTKNILDIYGKVYNGLKKCLTDYEQLWNLRMEYIEAFNFVKYTPGKYFKVHNDDGPYYSCTVSAVFYLNDDYEGGELLFNRQGISFKPKAGDLVLFPSTFTYEHSSEPIISGNKYCVVIMTDYNDKNHKGQNYG